MASFSMAYSARIAQDGYLEVLKWAVMNGCPWIKEECLIEAKIFNHTSVVEWINKN